MLTHDTSAKGRTRALPLFSFLMLCYIQRRNIGDIAKVGRAVQSVMDQTDERWQIVMVHDGPSEECRSIWVDSKKQFPGKIEYVEAPYVGTRGGHQSVNVGKEYCTGEFTTILNGDNYLRPDYIEKLYDADSDILVCSVLMNDMPGYILNGKGLHRGSVDRLNYSIRTGVVQSVKHRMHIDADYDFIKDCTDYIMQTHSPRVKFVETVLAEHN